MKITDAFRGEHGVFYAQFDALEQHLVVDAEHAAEVNALAHLLASALVSHAKLEDELLFNQLMERTGPDVGPVQIMRAEHEDIEGALAQAQATRDLGEAQEVLLHAIDRAREHFAKEEMVLFPLAEREIDRRRLEELGDHWASRRAVAVTTA
jgi:hemerythrin-like domain-containing protein